MYLLFSLLCFFAGGETAAEWYAHGMQAASSADYQTARSSFARAVELDPASPALRVNLGVTLVKLGLTTEAIREFRAALGRAPDNLTALNNLGSLYLNLGKHGEALPLLERAGKLAPADEDVRQKLMSAALGRAGELLSAGESQKAIDVIAARGNTARENKYARWILGSAHEQLQQYPAAFEEFAAAVDLDPADRRAYLPLGLLALKAKTPQMSQKVFEDALARFPGAPEFTLGLALVAQSRGNSVVAEQTCRELIRDHPDAAPPRLFLAALRLDVRDFTGALEHLQPVLDREPRNLLALYLRAVAQMESYPADADGAMEGLHAALTGDARFAPAHILLARFYAKKGEAAQTESHLRQAVAAQPDSAQARYLLSQFHRRQGDPAKAMEELQEFERARQHEKHSAGLLRQLFYGADETEERRGQ